MELTIKNYMLLSTLIEEYKNEKELEKQILKHFNMMDKSVLESKVFINSLLNDLNKQDYEHKLTFEFKGVKYGFIPNLNEITTAEWVDLESYQNTSENIHRVMAILYRPITKKKGDFYSIEKYSGTEKLSQIFMDLPVSYWKGAMFFFYNLSKELLKGINISIKNQKETLMKQMK
jgi:hypothetical protein